MLIWLNKCVFTVFEMLGIIFQFYNSLFSIKMNKISFAKWINVKLSNCKIFELKYWIKLKLVVENLDFKSKSKYFSSKWIVELPTRKSVPTTESEVSRQDLAFGVLFVVFMVATIEQQHEWIVEENLKRLMKNVLWING